MPTIPIAGSAFIRREGLISSVINGAISGGVFFAVFGGEGQVPIYGSPGFVLDFLIQGFMSALAATMIPGLLVRKAIRNHKVEAHQVRSLPLRSLMVWGASAAVVSALVSCALWFLVFWLAGVDVISTTAGAIIKIVYGAALGAFLTQMLLTPARQ